MWIIILTWWGIGFISSLVGTKIVNTFEFQKGSPNRNVDVGDLLISIFVAFGGVITTIVYVVWIFTVSSVPDKLDDYFDDLGGRISRGWNKLMNTKLF